MNKTQQEKLVSHLLSRLEQGYTCKVFVQQDTESHDVACVASGASVYTVFENGNEFINGEKQ
ncbi:MAG: hypothetical protein EOM12_03435 [Verrucomicrobiae bacterium]|nr:hypothetical protein [Verrucomicrobiae bacterium]